jgi:hypothetical protein
VAIIVTTKVNELNRIIITESRAFLQGGAANHNYHFVQGLNLVSAATKYFCKLSRSSRRRAFTP